MSAPLDQKRIAELIGMLQQLIEAWPNLDDDDGDRLVAILLPKLQQRSGLDVFAFRAAVGALLSPPQPDSDSPTRH